MFTLLVGLCGAETETLAVVRDFTFFTGTSNGSETFALSFYTNCLFFLIVSDFLEYQRYGECSYYYRLSCLGQILFLMHWFARFVETNNFYR